MIIFFLNLEQIVIRIDILIRNLLFILHPVFNVVVHLSSTKTMIMTIIIIMTMTVTVTMTVIMTVIMTLQTISLDIYIIRRVSRLKNDVLIS